MYSCCACKHNMNKNVKLFCCAVGIFVCYFYVGVITEKITKAKYEDGEKEEKFVYWMSLVLVQCLVNYICARITVAIVMRHTEDTTRLFYYATSALANTLAMLSSNMALQWVSYPTQVVAKSGKPIPVLLLGVLIGKKSYIWRKYLFVLMIVTGIIVFTYRGDSSNSKSNSSLIGIGEIILTVSLLLDGVTGAIQERMRSEHNVKPLHLMLNTNFWAVFYLTVPFLATGEVLTFSSFIKRHPNVLYQLATLSVAGVCGQYFIHTTVADFGPLPCSVITTTRKFFTVLGSVLIFGHTLLLQQWIAAGVVFTGLALDMFLPGEKKQVTSMARRAEQLNKMIQEEGLSIDDELSNQLQQHLQSAPEFVQIFWEEHKRVNMEMADMKWHPLLLRWALNQMSISSLADMDMTQQGFIRFTSGRTLYEYTQVDFSSGNLNQGVVQLLAKAGGEIPSPLDAYVVLVLSELSLFQNILYHKETGEVIGYAFLDTVEEELHRLEQVLAENKVEETAPVSKTVLVYTAKPVASHANGIVAFYPSDQLTMDALESTTMAVIGLLELAGIYVIAIVDGNPVSAEWFSIQKPLTRLTPGVVNNILSNLVGNGEIHVIPEIN